MTEAAVVFDLHQARLELRTDHAKLADFTRRFAGELLTGEGEGAQITVRLGWGVKAVPPSGPETRQAGRQVYLAQDGSLWLMRSPALPGLGMRLRWQGRRLEIEAWYRPETHLRRLLLGVGWKPEALFGGLIYSLVYFPLFLYLEWTRGWKLVHAGAVQTPQGCFLLAGLPGSGKSTLALGFLAGPGSFLLSDNLLLTDGERVYAVPEPLHLDALSRALAGPAAWARVEAIGGAFSYGRAVYRPLRAARRLEARPQAVWFISRAEAPRWQPLAAAAAAQRLEAMDLAAREVLAYRQFAGLAASGAPEGLPVAPVGPLSLPAFEVSLPSRTGMETLIPWLLERCRPEMSSLSPRPGLELQAPGRLERR